MNCPALSTPPPEPSSGLTALVYVSTAVRLLEETEIVHLLVRARRRNRDAGVTGVLLYADGNFMQLLEGPAPAVEFVYGIIDQDPLHRGLIELRRERVASRAFARWSMGFRACRGGAAGLEPDVELDSRLSASAGEHVAMLAKFWNRGNGPGGE
jgi:hypothetical protein